MKIFINSGNISLMLLLFIISLSSSAPDSDLVTSLPGINFKPTFKHYSGFLKASDKRYFHYWYTEAQYNPQTAPFILWLTGGPGCSSIGALIEELGPFHVSNYGNTVYENPYSWNKIGNVLFLSSPAGVGYSFSTNGNITTDDDDVARDNYNALIYFLKYKFPELQGRDFFVTGESYGGVYIPTLSSLLVDDTSGLFNFKGMAIGNGMYNFPNNYNTMVSLFYYRGFMRQQLYDKVANKCCNGNPYNCDYFSLLKKPGTECRTLILYQLNSEDGLNTYNNYYQCYTDSSTGLRKKFIKRQFLRMIGVNGKEYSSIFSSTTYPLPLCAQSNNTEIYMNRKDVRSALNIPSILPYWTDCSDAVGEAYQITHYDMTPEFNKILKAKKRVLIYNGDVDSACNVIMNEQFINNLNLTVIGSDKLVTSNWYYADDIPNIAGNYIKYQEGLDFLTVHSSGHFVPTDKPREALQMLYNFIYQNDYSKPVPFSTSKQPTLDLL
uniref:Carboxypeptidase n=1 Tax=Strongyloides papillosus TaxID=174720 RepID=A0A0N5C1H2_STREA